MFGDQNFEHDVINRFFQQINEWISLHGLDIKPPLNEHLVNEAFSISNLSSQTLDYLTDLNFSLLAYLYALQAEYNECKTILDFSTDSIYYIISDMPTYESEKYLKSEEKYNKRVKGHPLCMELNKLKIHANARINLLSNKVEIIQRMVDSINQVIRRKGYRNEH
jgi:hypothetical protein